MGKIIIREKDCLKMGDNFADIKSFTQHSLKEVWDNPEDEIWSSYIKK